VDVLPAIALNDPVRFLVGHGQHCFQACASYGQTKFIRDQPLKYRELVRLLKWWKKQKKWPTHNTAPISYLLELIALHVFNTHAMEASPLEDLFQRSMELFLQRRPETIAWNAFYSLDRIPPMPSPTATQLPFAVIDPRNPHNNVAATLADAVPLREYAEETLVAMKQGLRQWAARFREEKEAQLQAVEVALSTSTSQSKLLQAICTMPHSVTLTVPYAEDLIDVSKAQARQSGVSSFSPLFSLSLGVKPIASEMTTPYGSNRQVRWIQCTLHTDSLPLSGEMKAAASVVRRVILRCSLQLRWWAHGKDHPARITQPLPSNFELTLSEFEAKKAFILTEQKSKLRYLESGSYAREIGMVLDEMRGHFGCHAQRAPEFICTVAAQVAF